MVGHAVGTRGSGGKGIRTLGPRLNDHTLSRRALSTTQAPLQIYSGESGIRTQGPGKCTRPTVFKTAAFVHSANSPWGRNRLAKPPSSRVPSSMGLHHTARSAHQGFHLDPRVTEAQTGFEPAWNRFAGGRVTAPPLRLVLPGSRRHQEIPRSVAPSGEPSRTAERQGFEPWEPCGSPV